MHETMSSNLQCGGRPVGAGDCFTAAYAVGLLNDLSPEKALRFASGMYVLCERESHASLQARRPQDAFKERERCRVYQQERRWMISNLRDGRSVAKGVFTCDGRESEDASFWQTILKTTFVYRFCYSSA